MAKKSHHVNPAKEAAWEASPEQKKRRAQRNAARREAVKKYGKDALKGKEVDHVAKNRKGPLDNGNVQILTKKANRKKQPKRNGSQD